jgi:hypothetical protein
LKKKSSKPKLGDALPAGQPLEVKPGDHQSSSRMAPLVKEERSEKIQTKDLDRLRVKIRRDETEVLNHFDIMDNEIQTLQGKRESRDITDE